MQRKVGRAFARHWAVGSMALALAAGGAPLLAQGVVDEEPKLHIHGYLSQAYAIAGEHQMLGIPEDGTSDYRTAALQFRYAMTTKDNFVLQFSHERLARSPLAPVTPDIEVDWVFYERRFGDAFAAKVGKIPIPYGIYNEIRDVGTLLPFYRPPVDVYWEGTRLSETVNGVALSLTLGGGGGFGVQADAYYGGWPFLDEMGAGQSQASDMLGAQVWLTTPLEGLRFGIGGLKGNVPLTSTVGFDDDAERWNAMVDGSFGRVRVTGEYVKNSYVMGHLEGMYGQVTVRPTNKLSVNLLAARQDLDIEPFPGFRVDRRYNRDFAAGLNYALRPDLVLKLEHHWTEGLLVEDVPGNLQLGPDYGSNYAILSLSASF